MVCLRSNHRDGICLCLQPTIAPVTLCAGAQTAPGTLAAEANVRQTRGKHMRTIIAVLLIGAMCATAAATEEEDNVEQLKVTTQKLVELESLPVGIRVAHTQSPILATWDGSKELKCKWTYETTVSSIDRTITVEEFGMFYWFGERWLFGNYTEDPFSRQDFEKWYTCPDAMLTSGSSFTDPSNWSASSCLSPGKSRWYFIGTDSNGVRVKGEGIVELVGEFVEVEH